MPPHSANEYSDEVFEVQHQLLPHDHDHHQSHYPSFIEEINAILHGSNPEHHTNGSQTGSGSALTGSSGQGNEDDSYHFVVVGALIVPLVVTIGVIFFIALLVRRMRRAESLKDMARRNELAMNDISTSPSGSVSTSPSPSASSSMSLHMIGNGSSSGSDFEGQSTPPSPTSSQSSAPQFNPPWFLYSTSYYRSQYNLNKLQHEMSSYIGSVQSLPTHHAVSSTMSPYITQPLSNYDLEESENSKTNLKRSSSAKKFKRVFHIMNFPKRIRQHQADKNRFNIYTVPMETREQLKQIYVY